MGASRARMDGAPSRARMDGARIRSCCGRAQHEWMVAAEERNRRGATRRPPVRDPDDRIVFSYDATAAPRAPAATEHSACVCGACPADSQAGQPRGVAATRASSESVSAVVGFAVAGCRGRGCGVSRPAAARRPLAHTSGAPRRWAASTVSEPFGSRSPSSRRVRAACVPVGAAVRAPDVHESPGQNDRACIQFSQPVRHSPLTPGSLHVV